MNDDTRDLVVERTFEASPEVIWEMWTEPAHFAAWYGPAGAQISVTTMDIRVGGRRLLRMEVATPDGPMQMWFTGEYLEVVDNQRLVFTDSLCDEIGQVLAPEQTGLPPGHPATTEVRVELEAAGSGTRMTLTHLGIPAGSPGAGGWTTALDKLAVVLREQHTR